jgi:coproporphyrinogen III oxidase-like Fe-S oxidoreductase
MIEDGLAAAGFEHYETSAFARPGVRCRHNLNYWQFGDYLGVGAGAHGKISFPNRITRHARIKQPREYLAVARGGASMTEDRTIDAKELPFEFMLNALRLIDGFPTEMYSARTGLPVLGVEAALADAEEKGLIERTATRIRPTERGRLFLNTLVGLFLP